MRTAGAGVVAVGFWAVRVGVGDGGRLLGAGRALGVGLGRAVGEDGG